MKEFFKQDGSLRRAFQIDSKKKTADSGIAGICRGWLLLQAS
jgi:hypothetical protein